MIWFLILLVLSSHGKVLEDLFDIILCSALCAFLLIQFRYSLIFPPRAVGRGKFASFFLTDPTFVLLVSSEIRLGLG